MSDLNSSSNNSIWVISILLLIFITLKLTAVIDWSWWWVSAPVWSPAILVFYVDLVYQTCTTSKKKKCKS